ncbi:TonB-dependent receptor plug domain-containing protein [Ornithobacterium rhinotracheale]
MFTKKFLLFFIVLCGLSLEAQCPHNFIVKTEEGKEIHDFWVTYQGETFKCSQGDSIFYPEKGTKLKFKKEGFSGKTVEVSGEKQWVVLQGKEQEYSLNPMVITGTRMPKPLRKSAIYTRVITSKQINATGNVDLEGVLTQEIPYISFTNHAGEPNIKFHGLGGNSVLVLVNGERLAGETRNNVDYNQINLNDIDRIEVLQGASSTLYGSGAVGGVINIITKKPFRGFNLGLSSLYNSQKQSKNNLNLSYSNDKLSTKTIFNYDFWAEKEFKDSELAFRTYENGEIEKDKTLNTTFAPEQFFWKVGQIVGYKFNENLEASVDVSHFFKDRKSTGAEKSIFKNTFSDNAGVLRVNYRRNHWEHQFSYNINTYQKREVFLKKDSISDHYNSSIFNAKYAVNYKKDKIGVLSGAEFFSQRLKTYMFQENGTKRVHSYSFFSQLDWQLGKNAFLLAGARLESHQFYGTAFTPKIAFKHNIYRNISARWNFSTGFRSPSLKELYTDWDHLGMFRIIGSTDLKPEHSKHYMLTIEQNGKKFYNAINFFKTDIKDKLGLRYKNAHQDTLQYQNFEKQNVWGIDFMSKISVLKNVNINLGYGYTKDEMKINGKNASDTRPHAFNYSVEYQTKLSPSLATSVSCNGNYYSGIKFWVKDNYNKFFYQDYPAYYVMGLNATLKYKKYARLNLGVRNMLNYKPKNYNFYNPMIDGALYYISINLNN